PRGSLGVLESLACRIAAITGRAAPPLPARAVVVMAADHGVAAEGVSAYPAEVTQQMLANFARGGAAINVLARQAGAEVVVVNMGVQGESDKWQVTSDETRQGIFSSLLTSHLSLGGGTANFTRGPAMTSQQVLRA